MCMYPSLTERTPCAGRQLYFAAGMASASSTIFFDTSSRSCRNSARKPFFGAPFCGGAFIAARGAASGGVHSSTAATASSGRIFIATKLLLLYVRQQRVIGAEDDVLRIRGKLLLDRHRGVLHRYENRRHLVSVELQPHRHDEHEVGREVGALHVQREAVGVAVGLDLG